MRHAARLAGAAVLAAMLAGCGNQPGAVTGRQAVGSAVDLLRQSVGLDEAPERVRPDRERIEAIGAPVIWATLAVDPVGGGFIGLVENRGEVSFISPDRQTLRLRGGQLAATRGLVEDLAGYASDPAADPVVRPRPPADWPDRVERIYRFSDTMGGEFVRAAVCRPQVIGPAEVEIFGVTRTLAEIAEPCRTPYRAFENRYWIDPDTGFVWRSVQWLGPVMGAITLEVVVPAAPSSAP